MSDIQLNDDHDLDFVNGDLVLTTGVDAIRQHLIQRLKAFRGEWFMDVSDGVPYFQEILKKNPRLQVVDASLKQAILGTPGVIELLTYDVDLDAATRTLSLSFSCRTTSGEVVLEGVTVP